MLHRLSSVGARASALTARPSRSFTALHARTSDSHNNNNGGGGGGGGWGRAAPLLFVGGAAAVLGGAVVADSKRSPPPPADHKKLPIIPLAEVKEHASRETGVWVTFRGGVYDMTGFIDAHPGGSTRLLMAAGNDMEPYWEVYRTHLRGHVEEWMQKYRIGNLSEKDAKLATNEFVFEDPYKNDPKRSPDHLGTMQKPWCGEPRLELLTKSYLTPNDLFYVRNHLPVPDIDPKEYRLVVKGNGVSKKVFTLDDIKKNFPKHEVVSTLICAGNRREDLHGDRGIFISPHWVVGAISNAKWGGAKLRDVLASCGLDVDAMARGEKDSESIQHVQFEGYDEDETGLHYGGSIPVDKAVDFLGDCLVAYEMNGEPLPRDHGYPVRIIAPGHAGARQCKWLHKIIVASDESQKPWHQKSYRGFAPNISFEDDLSHWPHGLRLDQAPIVQEMPVQSLVCNPPPLYVFNKDTKSITVKGIAWAGGGRGIGRVDVTTDGGKTWVAAELTKPIKQRRNHQWGWTHFEKEIPLTPEVLEKVKKGEEVSLELASKAATTDFNVQPERPEPYWNARGVCINHWYRVPVKIDPKAKADVHPDKEFGNTPTTGFGNLPSTGAFHRDPWAHHGWDKK